MRPRLKPDEPPQRQMLDELNQKLVDKYFVNFSVFESMPDVWAIDQVFPIVPIEGLDRAPERRGVIADLTCDSDGRIDQYVDSDGVDVSLPLHALRDGEPYRLGIFLVGAYQETLGDIHNLFGDTDAVNVRIDRRTAATRSRTSSAATRRTSCSITSATISTRCAPRIATRSKEPGSAATRPRASRQRSRRA